MYVYLIAPLLLMIAVVLGWGPRHIPLRGYGIMSVVVVALAIIDYFVGYFPAITWPFLVFMLLFVLAVWGIRMVLERIVPMLTKNRRLLIILLIIFAFILMSVFGFGAIIFIAIGIWSAFSGARRPRGPRPLSEAGGWLSGIEGFRRSLQKLGPLTVLFAGTTAALLLSLIISGSAVNVTAAFTYGPQVDLVHAKVTSTLPPINVNDVPIVEKDSASLVLSNAIGSLGPQFHVSQRSLSLVRYQGQLVWTAPLDYNNGLIWLTKHYSPGYIYTSANNPSSKPVLVLNQSYMITPEAGFSYNLTRVLYQHFPTKIIGTSDWEIDPKGNGYWVTSLYEPAPGLAGLVTRVIVGSALTNPTTGQVTYYPLGQQPTWVSQIVGPNFAQNEAQRFGWDRSGFIAATFTHANTTQPVHATPYNVLLGNGGLGWEIPMTSPNPGDNSLSGIILVDAETNKVTYTAFTGMQNDLSISQRIDGATINSSLQSGRALLYNVAGTLAYIAPVVNQSGIVQQVAITDPKNVAQPIIAGNISDAVAGWQSYLAGNPGNGAPSTIKPNQTRGTVSRVATLLESSGANNAAVKEYWLFLINGKSYRASLSVDPNVVPFVQKGDHVTVTWWPNASSPITVQSITDQSLQ